ncbi:MAG: PQQ-like beta-propeller repeat protein [Rhodanobacteraceae bacterium]|nr:PQQ-like beta-propeller repeat protein [Rhodanobacteraceae bacterium]
MKSPLFLALLCAAAAAGQAAADTQFRGDAAHSGVYAGPVLHQKPAVKWRYQTGDAVIGSAVVDSGTVYFGSNDGQIYALDAATGRRRWNLVTGGPVPATPAIAKGTLYVPSYDGKFYALDAANGNQRWKFATGGERRYEARGVHGLQPRTQTIADIFDTYLSSPTVVDGTVYFGSGDNHVYALDANTGALRWKFKTGDVVHASPAYADGVIYVGSWDGKFYALDARDGHERWHYQAGVDEAVHNQQGFQSSAAIVGGVVYVGCRDSHVYAFKAATGEKLWDFSTGLSWVNTTPAVRDGKVYVATSDSHLIHVLNAADGKELYQQPAASAIWSSLSLAGDVFYVGQFNGSLEGRAVADGKVLWTFRTEAAKANVGWVLDAAGAMNNPLLFRSAWSDQSVAALYRQYSVGSFLASPTPGGSALFIGSTDGAMYALE